MACYLTLALGVFISGLNVAFLLGFRQRLPYLFTSDAELIEKAQAQDLFVVVALYQFPDALDGVEQGIFRAIGKQALAAKLNFVLSGFHWDTFWQYRSGWALKGFDSTTPTTDTDTDAPLDPIATMDPSEGAKNQGDGGGSMHHDGASMNQPHGLHPGSMMMGMWSGPAGSHMMPALQRRSSGGAGQDGDVNLTNYLAARAHAAHMCAAEESRRLEENLMRLEMRRMMMGRSSLGGAATGDQGDAAKGKGEALQSRASQTSNASDQAAGDQDSALMARAQQFNVGGGSQMDMNSLTLSQYQYMMNQSMMNQSMMMGFGVPYGLAHLTAAAQGLAMPVNDPTAQAKGEEGKAEGKSSKSKGKGKKVEKNPRRPLSAYNIFFSEQRDILLKEAAGEDRDDDAADAASTEDPKDIHAYAEKLMSKRLEKKRPKRAHRKSHGKVAFTALAKSVGAKWRALDDAGKKKYRDIADIDRERYRREKAALGKKVQSNVRRKRAAEAVAQVQQQAQA